MVDEGDVAVVVVDMAVHVTIYVTLNLNGTHIATTIATVVRAVADAVVMAEAADVEAVEVIEAAVNYAFDATREVI